MRIGIDKAGDHAITLISDEVHKLEMVKVQEGDVYGLEFRIYDRHSGGLTGCARIESDWPLRLRQVAYELLHLADEMPAP